MGAKRALDARDREVRRHRSFLAVLSIGLLGLTVILAAENMRISGKSHLVPYVIQTDQSGRILNTEVLTDRSLERNFTPERMISAELGGWVEAWRAVTTDQWAQKSLADHVFSMVAADSEASSWLIAWFRTGHDPLERGKRVRVEVLIKSVMRVGGTTYEVFWQEKESDLSGRNTVMSNWRSKITVKVNPPKDDADVHRNRSGLFVTELTDPIKEDK
jgi:type IV secretory pathway TrbF-like protein